MKPAGQRLDATGQSITSPIGFGQHDHDHDHGDDTCEGDGDDNRDGVDDDVDDVFKVDEYGHVEGDTPAEQEVSNNHNIDIAIFIIIILTSY